MFESNVRVSERASGSFVVEYGDSLGWTIHKVFTNNEAALYEARLVKDRLKREELFKQTVKVTYL